ncbi:WRB/Get1 family [Phakopsora pachyrhizi]|uniref:WRB/Get1 family n=1 Tax=Phakopsora pachyrhizi TaxID=170000 RepID=A0AAV0BFZ0_PHAPC|nr:WRB/Get1 family [Phakopsora pachyrhizi]
MLAVYVFLVIFSGRLIRWIGQTRLNDWAHSFFLLATRSKLSKDRKKLKSEILKTKLEFQSTSSQDEFAKWARLRRKMDKEVADLENLNKQITSARAKFSTAFSSVIWTFTTGLQLVLVSWHRKTPVFFLPQDWFPPMIVWILGLPSAPYGAVSTTVWSMVCKRALSVISGLILDIFTMIFGMIYYVPFKNEKKNYD